MANLEDIGIRYEAEIVRAGKRFKVVRWALDPYVGEGERFRDSVIEGGYGKHETFHKTLSAARKAARKWVEGGLYDSK